MDIFTINDFVKINENLKIKINEKDKLIKKQETIIGNLHGFNERIKLQQQRCEKKLTDVRVEAEQQLYKAGEASVQNKKILKEEKLKNNKLQKKIDKLLKGYGKLNKIRGGNGNSLNITSIIGFVEELVNENSKLLNENKNYKKLNNKLNDNYEILNNKFCKLEGMKNCMKNVMESFNC